MYDSFNRHINYLRISVTDRCNLRCTYCVPTEGFKLMPEKNILTSDQIAEVVKIAASYGITKIRLTGGEPLVRPNIIEIVAKIKLISDIKEIALTTNGTRLAKLAKPLKDAGLDRVNISLDTLDPQKYFAITHGKLSDVLEGIEAAIEAGLTPIKINFVRIKNVNEDDELVVKKFCEKKGLQIRYIRQMNLEKGEFYPVEGGMGGICKLCNRLRLTADGVFKSCLHSNLGFNIKDLGTEQALKLAVELKPEKGKASNTHNFYNIGG